MSDFKTVALSAVHVVWPNAILDGCFYRLSQCVYRKVQEEGLAQLYADDDNFALWIKMLPALAFVPLFVVVNAFENLQQNLPVDADPISNYFEDNFIGRLRGRIRQPPRFPVDLWNIHDRVNLDLPRTSSP